MLSIGNQGLDVWENSIPFLSSKHGGQMFRTVEQHAEHWAFSIWPDAPLFEHGEIEHLDSPFMGNTCHYGYISQDPSFSLLLLNTTFLLSELLPQVLKKFTLHIEIVYRKQNLDKWPSDTTVFQITLIKQKMVLEDPEAWTESMVQFQQDSQLQIWLRATTVTQLLVSVDRHSNPPANVLTDVLRICKPRAAAVGRTVRTDLYCW